MPFKQQIRLGTEKMMWEAMFDRKFDGDVVESVLDGAPLCKYVIYIPKEIMDKNV